MNQSQLNREVARVTGETVHFIREMGFTHVDVPIPAHVPKKAGRMNGRHFRRNRRCFVARVMQAKQVA